MRKAVPSANNSSTVSRPHTLYIHPCGVFPTPTVVQEEICEKYGVRKLGELDSVRERFYAISAERKIKHPAVARIVSSAKAGLFGDVAR